jgi:hypothetical protein
LLVDVDLRTFRIPSLAPLAPPPIPAFAIANLSLAPVMMPRPHVYPRCYRH